tara:strand:+ start:5860 stop:6216 length:357 start_codon:yes stop_codon:yes gene_type:complete
MGCNKSKIVKPTHNDINNIERETIIYIDPKENIKPKKIFVNGVYYDIQYKINDNIHEIKYYDGIYTNNIYINVKTDIYNDDNNDNNDTYNKNDNNDGNNKINNAPFKKTILPLRKLKN